MKRLIYLLILPLLISGCSDEQTLPAATGSVYECLIVSPAHKLSAEQQQAFDDVFPNSNGSGYETTPTNIQEIISSVLGESMPCMPQAEPYFKTSVVYPDAFDGLLKPTRNVVYVDINRHKYTHTRVHYDTDVYSRPQAMARIQSPSADSLFVWWLEHGIEVRDWLVDQEIRRAKTFLRGATNEEACKAIQAMGVNMFIPSEYLLVRSEKDFVWCSNPRGAVRRDIVIYRRPYTSSLQFTLGELLATRDSVMGANVSAVTPGSYMGTEYRYEPPIISLIHGGVEVRGLWKMYGGEAMGGPFVNRTFFDSTRRWLITTESFVFGPDQKKRNPLRQTEAILQTATLK